MRREIQFEDFRLAFVKLWNYKVVIFFVTLAGLFAGLLYTSNAADAQAYLAKSSVYFAAGSSNSPSASQTMMSYYDVVTSAKVCEYAASLINNTSITAEKIQSMIYVTVSDKSYVLNINAQSTDAELAIKIANAVAEAFTSEVNIMGNNSIQVLDVANGAVRVKNKNINTKRLEFMLGAFILVCSIIIIRSMLSDKVQSIAQCVENEDEILGIVPEVE